ncbi:hypothetical protein BC938DRAFT_476969 [Jimgerdemannia flammicorona]|uniref:Uncharacterized protein n=1 Tax=Jimgerdemannia flammicorona TaxID=994334 RepID=A0A433QPW6_9FUNG|nr:hypothetical protein BC938DRAFT_476969 [Jimgerdemannia flammicorona]
MKIIAISDKRCLTVRKAQNKRPQSEFEPRPRDAIPIPSKLNLPPTRHFPFPTLSSLHITLLQVRRTVSSYPHSKLIETALRERRF